MDVIGSIKKGEGLNDAKRYETEEQLVLVLFILWF